jgi:putative membrane protein
MTKSRALAAILMIVGVLVLLSGLSLAQQDQDANANNTVGRTANANGNTNQNAMARSADAKFMMTAAAGGMAEVELGRLALERASSDSVKQYAQRMIDDHTKANQDLMQVASTKGVTLPTGPDAKHMALMERLRRQSGAGFDRMYIKEAGIKDHQNMEKLFRNETIKGKDADVMAFASRTLPAVQEHLRMAREMSGTMAGSTTSTNANTGSSMGDNMNANGNSNGNMNGNANGNMNVNGNRNRNSNRNSNSNSNRNRNGNINANGNMNGNANGNTNANTSNGNTTP